MTGFEGIIARLSRHARHIPHQRAVIFCRGNRTGYTETAVRYGELDRLARATAVWLRERAAPGDRVMLLYPQGIPFVTSFLGCLYAGLVPVAAPLPAANRGHAERTDGVVRDASVRLILTDPANLTDVAGWLDAHGLQDEGYRAQVAGVGDASAWADPAAGAEALAFLQYTSGSTGAPRGVMVGHGNVERNIRMLAGLHGWEGAGTFCSWLPAYHDMGLIAMLLGPLYLGGTVVLLSPTDFLMRPHLWLTLIGAYQAQVSCAPSFAYELCTRRITDAQLARLDLSGWQCACNGAEPVDPGTMTRFAQRFAPAGFRLDSFAPGYGLAEATLCVSATRSDEPPRFSQVDADALERNEVRPAVPGRPRRTLVASGRPEDHAVRIVDPVTRDVLPNGRVGEIWVGGDSVAQGYWQQPDRTQETFRAHAADGSGPFLRTGDLGMLGDPDGAARDRLYVTGRLKDVLVVHGRNLYPHDIERTVMQLDEAFTGRSCCVFPVQVPQEEIVVVQEIRAPGLDEARCARLTSLIRHEAGTVLGVRIANVVLTRVGQIPKTTSGKIRRSLTSELFRAGRLAAVHEDLDAATRARYRTSAPALVAAGDQP